MPQSQVADQPMAPKEGILNHTGANKIQEYTKCEVISEVRHSCVAFGPDVIKLFSCSTQLSTKFILLISMINTSET